MEHCWNCNKELPPSGYYYMLGLKCKSWLFCSQKCADEYVERKLKDGEITRTVDNNLWSISPDIPQEGYVLNNSKA